MFPDDEECDLPLTAATVAPRLDNDQERGAHSISVLIPPNHKSTRIVHTSGLSFMSAETPPPPVPSRTRHIPVPVRRNMNGTVNPLSGHKYWGQSTLDCDLSEGEPCEAPPPVPPHRTRVNTERIERQLLAKSDSNSIQVGPNPPPVPPHRSKSHLKQASATDQPSRPRHLSLTSKHTPQSVDYLCDSKLDYKTMVAVLDRLKESSA